MKNYKKGFTLVELLAVIAILAILIVIAVPAILDLFSSSKEGAFITQAQSLYKLAEQEIITQQINPIGAGSPSQFCYVYINSNNSEIGPATLSLEGTRKVSYDIRVSNGKITSFKISNNEYSITLPKPEDTGADVALSDIERIDSNFDKVTSCE